MKKTKTLLLCTILFVCNLLYSQVGIGTTNPQAALDVDSNIGGVAVPRLTIEQINALVLPAKSSIVYNTDTDELNYNFGTPEIPNWKRLKTVEPPAEIHLVPQNIYYSVPGRNVYYTYSEILSPKSENYDHSLFSYNNPNGSLSILKKGHYEICTRFFSGTRIARYYLNISLNNNQVFNFAAHETTIDGGGMGATSCDSYNFTQDNNTISFTTQVGTPNNVAVGAAIFYISARKID